MSDNELERRLQYLSDRLHAAYGSIGHSSGRPYVYFVYPPQQERTMQRLAEDYLHSDATLRVFHIDVLPIVVQSLNGQEERREELLNTSPAAADAIMRLWAKNIRRIIASYLEENISGRPVAVLEGLAALHPLGDPTKLMEQMAEEELRDPSTNAVVPIVLLVPGVRPPQTSRSYLFLGLKKARCDFYRGEEA